ncbi:MAG: T9SS type A sorting domain-containing protein [Bacteroidia bacterium]|nr:T9SS type A sorting domain-containing protein [Bacteroidia bacterium]
MKKISLLKTLVVLLVLLASTGTKSYAQLGLTATNSTLCASSSTMPIYWAFTSTVSGTAYYTFTVTTNCGSGPVNSYYGYSSSTSNGTINVCPGTYTINVFAVNSSSAVIGTAVTSGAFNTAPYPIINVSPNGGAGCVGASFTVNLSGASNYTSTGAFGTNTNTSFVVTPTASSCFTVQSSAGSCTAASVKCFTLYSPTSVNVTASVNACSGNSISIPASGATSYTWSNGSLSPNLNITPTASACYTVTGSNLYCPGTSTAVTCVNVLPTPTLSYGASTNSLCLGGSVTLTASGATNYTWTITQSSISSVSSPTNTVVFTPTNAGVYFAQIIGSSGCSVNGSVSFTVASPPNVSATSSVNICSGYGGNLFASGASSYTWSTGALTSMVFVTPTANTCYTVVGSNPACPGTSSAVVCVTIAPTPTVSISGLTTLCAGSTATYVASGASTYTWYAASTSTFLGSGPSVVVNANTGCVAVYALSSSGCFGSNTICPTILPSPTITVSSPTGVVCAGSSLTLSASGASSYTWNTGSNANSIVVSPSGSTCYTVTGTNSNGCVASTVKCITITANPVITTGGTSSLCPGANGTLTASGASTYTWSTSSTGNSIVVTPTASGCYTVIGTAVSGCTNSATKCITVLTAPALSVGGSNTVCVGSSVTFTATGGSTYTWNTGANTSTLNVLPTASTNYTVTASHATNSCTSTSTLALTVFTNCAIVWPGDANRDGVVNNSDVFELGLASGATGSARSGASISWAGQFANAWSGNVSTGWNKCHADCNGDGTVNNGDTLAIYNNYASTHAFRSSGSAANPDLILVPQQSEVYGGMWNVIDIVLGDASNPVSQLYGAAFDLDFDKSMVQSDSVKMVYTSSFLNASNQNIQFRKPSFTNGKLYAASVRTDATDVNGNGKIGELWFKLNTGIADNSSFNFGISAGKKVSANGSMGVLTTSGAMNMNVSNNGVGIKSNVLSASMVSMYPNPAKDKLVLVNTSGQTISYTLVDITGRKIAMGTFTGNSTLDVSNFDAGTYFIVFEAVNGRITNKLLIEK